MWTITYFAMWMLLVLMAIALIALARQVGLLHVRLAPSGPGMIEGKFVPGTTLDLPELVRSLDGRKVALTRPGLISVFVFVSPTCGICEEVLFGLRKLMAMEKRRTLFTVFVDGNKDPVAYLKKYGLTEGVLTDALGAIDPPGRPYALSTNAAGEILAAGVVNNLEQLEDLVDRASKTDGALGRGLSFVSDAQEPLAIPLYGSQDELEEGSAFTYEGGEVSPSG